MSSHLVKALTAILVFVTLGVALDRVVARPLRNGDAQLLKPSEFLFASISELFSFLDVDEDQRLSLDELPPRFKKTFGSLDFDHNGYISRTELQTAVTHESAHVVKRGPILADQIVTVAGDFVVDIYHNGLKVPDDRRTLLEEAAGLTVEKIDVELRHGDWLVFNVVHNPLRRSGVRSLAAAGIDRGSGTVAFTTESTTERWTACDDPALVAGFIADPDFLSDHLAKGIGTQWIVGDSLMNRHVAGWSGSPIWGKGSNTWLKFVAH